MYFYYYNNDNDHGYTDTYNFYFLPIGDTSTSGELINPDNNFDVNFDFDLINSIDYLTNSPSGNMEYIVNSNFSSGDLFGIVYNDYDDWGFGSYVTNFLNNCFNLLSIYDNISLDFGFLGYISSSDFVSPDNALFTFVSILSNSLLIIGCFAFLYNMILDLGTFNVDNIIKDKEDLLIV